MQMKQLNEEREEEDKVFLTSLSTPPFLISPLSLAGNDGLDPRTSVVNSTH